MRLPGFTDRVKDVPVRALRTVFAGIGQLLLAAERATAEEPDSAQGSSATEEHQDPFGRRAGQHGDEVGAAATSTAASPAAGGSPGRATDGTPESVTKLAGRSDRGIADSAAGDAGGQRRKSGKTGKSGNVARTARAAKSTGATRISKTGQPVTKRVREPVRPDKPDKPASETGTRKGTSKAQEQSRWRSLDSTGNVRLLTPEEIAQNRPADPGAAAAPGTTQATGAHQTTPAARKPPTTQTTPAPRKPPRKPPTTQTTPAGQDTRAARTADPVAPGSLPLPGYDDLSLASLRARLRNLDADQLRALIRYEKSNAGRDDVITMFERRIARLSGET
jgi:hypothetical protein